MKIFFILGLLYMWSMQPYLMIMGIILLTIMYSIFLMFIMNSFWYSYMLILIMMSGILILFTYMVSLIPNVSFEMMNLIYISMFIYFYTMFMCKIFMMFNMNFSLYLFKMWNNLISLYNIYFVIFLFLIMLMVVWITNFKMGAVRNF